MPFDPTYNPGVHDDCMRRAVAWHLDRHIRRVRFIDPDGDFMFWQAWHDYLLEYHDTRLTLWVPENVRHYGPSRSCSVPTTRVGRGELPVHRDRWVGILVGCEAHAVGMQHYWMMYDPSGGSRHFKDKRPKYGVLLDAV